MQSLCRYESNWKYQGAGRIGDRPRRILKTSAATTPLQRWQAKPADGPVPARIHLCQVEVGTLGRSRGEPDEERNELIRPVHPVIEVEVLVETHAGRGEDQPGGAEADRPGGDGPDSPPPRSRNMCRRVSISKKSIPSTNTSTPSRNSPTFSGVMASEYTRNCNSGLTARLFGHDFGLSLAQVSQGRAVLTIEVDQLETIGVSDVKGTDSQTGQSDEVNPSDPSHAGDRHPARTEALLFLGLEESVMAGKCLPV